MTTSSKRPTARQWRKSSYSGGGNDCVEVSFCGSAPAVRDSKAPEQGVLEIAEVQWRHLMTLAARGDLDAR